MRVLKSVNRRDLLMGFAFVGIVYLLYFIVPSESRGPINHAHFWLLGIPAFLIFHLLDEVMPRPGENSLYREHSPLGSVCSILGGVAGCGMFLFLIVVMAMGSVLGVSEPDLVQRVAVVKMVLWGLTIYVALCTLFLWKRYLVEKDTIVSVDGKLLYPGTWFTLYPWMRYKVKVLNRSFADSKDAALKVQCQDGTYDLEASFCANIDIEKAKAENVYSWDWSLGSVESADRILKILVSDAESMTLGQFMQVRRAPMEYEAADMPMVWDGKATLKLRQ